MNLINLAMELYNGDMTAANMFFYLLAKAAPEDCLQKGHRIAKGEYLCTKKELANALNLSRYKFDATLKTLIDNDKVTVSSSPQFTIIVITNYESYSKCESPFQSTHQATDRTTNEKKPIKQAIIDVADADDNTLNSIRNSVSKERNEEEREKKERSKERKEREEAKRENIPPYPPRGECEGGEKANSENNKPVCLAKPGENAKPAGEGVQGKGSLEGNSYLVHPQEQEGGQKVKEELGGGMAEEREKKESRRERKEKEAASSGKRAAKPKYFLSLSEAHQTIDRRLAGKSDALAAAMKEWATMRYALRKDGRLTERAIDNAFEFLNERRYDERQAIRCVQQSIDHLWIGLFDIQGGGA